MRIHSAVGALVSILILAALPSPGAKPYPLRDAVEFTVRGGLPNFFAKLEAGKALKIAYLGGSITSQRGWRPKTLKWFRKQYPKAKVAEIHAAIGGTGSGLGAFRLGHDVLQYKPDLLFVEFAVNDGGRRPAHIHRSMEGIVRQTWRTDPTTDICYVYTLTMRMMRHLQNGKYQRSASAMEEVADHYAIPSIHMGYEVARLEKAGKLVFKGPKPKTEKEKAALAGKILFSKDGVHPYTDTGHQVYLEAVVRGMTAIKGVGQPGPHSLETPLVADNWERATMVPLSKAKLSAGWQRLDPKTNRLAKRFSKRLPELWKATKPGETISFRFKGTHAAVYDLLGPDCGQVIVKVDDRKPSVRRLFDGYCTGHRLAQLGIGSGLEDTVHTVTLEIHPDQPDKAKILHDHRRPDMQKNPKKYDGTTWYAGAILVNGELVE